jgi:hypothetical protein
VALSEKQRSNLHRSLAPVVGEEEAEALLSQFPSRELDVPATKECVRGEIAGLRDELRTEIAGFRVDVARELHRMTVWFAGALVGSVVGGMGVAVGIASLT